MIKHIALFFAALPLLISGCASIQHAGNASYSVEPIITERGAVICCRIDIKDGKERASLSLHVVKHGDNYTVDLVEQGVEAFEGQKVAAGAAGTAVKTAGRVAAGVGIAPIVPMVIEAVK